MPGDDGSQNHPQRRPPSPATMRLLKEMETRLGGVIDDLDRLGMPLAAARAEHALDTFRREAERLTSG